MEKKVISFLYNEFKEAIAYCNDFAKKGSLKSFDVDTIDENFVFDMFSLSFYAISDNDKISSEEIARINFIMEDFGTVVNADNASELLAVAKVEPFEIPKTLVVFQLRSYLKILDARPETKSTVIDEELQFLDTIMYIYAYVMRSIPDVLSQKGEQIILDCLRLCCKYITNRLDVHFALSEKVIGVIKDSY